jgi:predicted O-methyltransferase YrrM
LTLLDILKPNKTRKIVVFGTGSLAEKVYAWLVDFNVEYFIDNNPNKWGDKFFNVEIKSPDALLEETPGTVLILIASSFVIEIEEQLQNMGFVLQEDMVDCNYIAYTAEGEFYSPLPSIKDVRAKKNEKTDKSHSALLGVDLNQSEQVSLLNDFSQYKDLFPYQKGAIKRTLRYPLTPNAFFDFPDAINLFCFMKKYQPKRIIEVGSGFSSALMLDVNEHFFNNAIELDFIEPYPERLYSLLSDKDKKSVNIHEKKLQDVALSCFEKLESGDILFIDSSHVVKVNSDVNWLFAEVLPRLKNGVLIHFHDIEFPFEYPSRWLHEGRAWNEAYMLRSFLQYNNVYKIIYWNSYLTVHHKKELDIHFSEYHGGGSIWLKKAEQ